jgi:hypothetical protein
MLVVSMSSASSVVCTGVFTVVCTGVFTWSA